MNLNRIVIIGNLTTDPFYSRAANGSLSASLTVATNHRWRGQDGAVNDIPEYHHVQGWDKIAESIQQIDPQANQLVYVEGRNQTRTYRDSKGVEYKTTEIIVHAFAVMVTKTQALKRRFKDKQS